ncbi:MAG TPA: DUF805 domain-containing protein [Candidatus Saccharimonadales bacterium]|nr:DUF805 domain-containing protein [Candidatus Saccharimonadales bacterium]
MDNQPTQPQAQANLGMFERRTGRLAFLLAIIYAMAPLIIVALLQMVVHFALASSTSSDVTTTTTSSNALTAIVNIISLLVGIVSVVLIIPVTISAYVRRLHDVNQSGLLTLLVFVPFVNLLLFLYLLFAPGTQGANKYGNPVNSYNYWVVTGLKKPVA